MNGQNTPSAILSDFSANNDVTLLIFGGIAGGIGIPPFEFFNLTTDIPINKIFLRDINQVWYHGVIPEVGNGIEGITITLQHLLDQQSPQRLVVCGNSMGGYAAILFGALLQANTILAFSPQTFIGRWQRLLVYDRRWQKQISHMYQSIYKNPGYFDLGSVLAQTVTIPEIHIHYSNRHRLDRLHARRLSKWATLHTWDLGSHQLVKKLRDNGELKLIIETALGIK